MDPYKLAQLQMFIATYPAQLVSKLTDRDHAIDNVEILPHGAVRVYTTTKGEPVMGMDGQGDDYYRVVYTKVDTKHKIKPPAAVVPLFLHTTTFIIPEALTVTAVNPLIADQRSSSTYWKKKGTTAWHTQPIFQHKGKHGMMPLFYQDPKPGLTRAFPVQADHFLCDNDVKNVVVGDGSHPAWAPGALHQFVPIPVLVINNDTRTFHFVKPAGQDT